MQDDEEQGLEDVLLLDLQPRPETPSFAKTDGRKNRHRGGATAGAATMDEGAAPMEMEALNQQGEVQGGEERGEDGGGGHKVEGVGDVGGS